MYGKNKNIIILYYNMVLENSLTDIKEFIVSNNIVGTSAGVCIALATKDGIQSLVSDIIVPSILILLNSLHINAFNKYLPINGNKGLNVNNFIKQLITFVLVIIISFLFVKIAFGYLLGIQENKNENEKKNENKNENKKENKYGMI
jgi:large-conductance mechanosensitive channel